MTTWELCDHACRNCGSRILHSGGRYRCACCGATSTGGPESICGCGITEQISATAVYRCTANPSQTQDNPAEIVIIALTNPSQDERASAARQPCKR